MDNEKLKKIFKSRLDFINIYNFIWEFLVSFKNYKNTIVKINMKLKNKKIRFPNFPSEISENIVRLCYFKKYGVLPEWDTKNGDLLIDNKKLEVKAFSSKGPSSFGPSESWKKIYFVDCKNFINDIFIVYEINLSNEDSSWKNIKLNKKDSYEDQCKQKRRPRIHFDNIKSQLEKKYINKLYEGNINLIF
jgi:hypothetical protein